MINFDCLNLYIIVPSTIFFYCLFQGYLSLNNINNFLHLYPWIGTALAWVLLICLLLYFTTDTVYAMGTVAEGSASDLPKPHVKVNTGDVTNSVNIKDSNINIPNSVATGLTNLGTGAAVAAGFRVSKYVGGSPAAKIGAAIVGGVAGAAIVIGANATNSIIQKNAYSVQSNTTTPKSNHGGDGPAAFSIEPSADIDTVMALLNSTFILQFCILYLLGALLVIYIANRVVENKLNFTFIKNIFGERIYYLVLKSLTYANKTNKIWLMVIFILLYISSLASLYFSYFILNHIDIISEIVQQSKGK